MTKRERTSAPTSFDEELDVDEPDSKRRRTAGLDKIHNDPAISVPCDQGLRKTYQIELPLRRRRIFLPHQHDIRQHFSVFNALLPRLDILLEIVKHLPPRTILNLFSISAPFHYQFSSNYTAFILSATRIWSPDAAHIFPWRCYSSLCIPDPALRLPTRFRSQASIPDIPPPHLHPIDAFSQPVRTIPSLRWLTMVVYRHLVAKEITAYLTVSGFPVPPSATVLALKKSWLLHDLQTNAHRVALIRNETYFTKYDLFHFLAFTVKVDMYFTDPVAYTGGERKAREWLFAERGWGTLWDWMRRESERDDAPEGSERRGVDRLDVLRLWVKHGYVPTPRGPFPETEEEQLAWEEPERYEVCGVPLQMCGRWGNEVWGRGMKKLLRPDELVMREGVRRELDLQRWIWRMMRWGYLDGNLEATKEWKAEEIVPSLILSRSFKARAEREQEERKRAEQMFVSMARLDVD